MSDKELGRKGSGTCFDQLKLSDQAILPAECCGMDGCMINAVTSRVVRYFSGGVVTLLAFLCAIVWSSANAGEAATIPPKISYYHWAHTYTDNPELIQTYKPAQLYLKLLDIGFRSQTLAINPTDVRVPPSIPVIPVVFLDNEALRNAPLDTVREQILTHIPPQTYRSLQMDCDWTEQTRDTYFAFLQRLHADYPHLSVTLRLHQVKYAEHTGVPPADRAVLMYYNMSDIQDTETKNYILDNAVGQRYLQNFAHYPLPLGLALPLYQQTRVIRQGKLVHLAGSASVNPDKTEVLETNHYRVTAGHYWQEYYLYPDDELRVDTVDLPALHQAAKQLAVVMHPDEIIFYTLNDAARFKPQALTDIATDFPLRSQPQ